MSIYILETERTDLETYLSAVSSTIVISEITPLYTFSDINSADKIITDTVDYTSYIIGIDTGGFELSSIPFSLTYESSSTSLKTVKFALIGSNTLIADDVEWAGSLDNTGLYTYLWSVTTTHYAPITAGVIRTDFEYSSLTALDANLSIQWNVLRSQSGVIKADNTAASGWYPLHGTSTVFGVTTAVSDQTDYIALTANSQLKTLYYNASVYGAWSGSRVSAQNVFVPWQIALTPFFQDVDNISVAATFINFSGTHMRDISGKLAYWEMDDNYTDLSATLIGTGNTEYDYSTLPTITDSDVTSSISLTSSSAIGNVYTLNYIIDDSLSGIRLPAYFTFSVYPTVNYGNTDFSETDSLYAIEIQNGTGILPPGLKIRWGVDNLTYSLSADYPSGGTDYPLSALIDPIYPSIVWGDEGDASTIGNIRFYITDVFDLSSSYNIYVSSNLPFSTPYHSGIPFTPFYYIQDTTDSLTAVLIQTNVNVPITYFDLKVYGMRGETVFNLAPEQDIIYENLSETNIIAYKTDDVNQYYWSPTELSQSSSLINPLNLEVTTDIVPTLPQNQSFRVNVSALGIYDPDAGNYDGVIDTSISFLVNQWISDTVFSCNFRLNNELVTTDTIYRLTSLYFPLSIWNEIIAPDNATGIARIGINGVEVTATSINFTEYVYPFNPLTASGTYVISLTAGSVSAVDWATTQSKIKTKNLIVLEAIPPADFIIFPDYKWDIGTDAFVLVSAGPLSLSQGPCAWGFCHTENFHFSALSADYVDYYWTVSGTSLGLNQQVVNDYPIGSNSDDIYYPVSLQLILDPFLPVGMPTHYYDDNTGDLVPYPNYTDTSILSSYHKQPILMKAFIGTSSLTATYQPVTISSAELTLLGYGAISGDMPVAQGAGSVYTWTVSTNNWSQQYVDNSPTRVVTINFNDIGQSGGIVRFQPTPITVSLDFACTFTAKEPAIANDYCSQLIDLPTVSETLTAYPVQPLVYTPNKYVLTSEQVVYENLVSIFDQVSGFIWTDRDVNYVVQNTLPYITSYNTEGTYDLTLTTVLTAQDLVSIFSNIITVYGTYQVFDEVKTRIFGVTELVLPYTASECELPANEWGESDNINASFTKLQYNLTYLGNMAQLYDFPSSEFYGWYGTSRGIGGSLDSYWKVNVPGIDSGYNRPQDGVNGKFTNLQDIIVKDIDGVGPSIIFVADSTTVSILSSNFVGTTITSISSKCFGDDFVNVKAIGLDSLNRIFVLDTPKNRVVVFSYDFDRGVWTLLYDWGGLGGQGARTKFRTPSDLFIDEDDQVWIADTDNLCIKMYTRTGSWKQTITTEHFDGNNKPISVTTDTDGNIYVLTNYNVVKFDSAGNFVDKYQIDQLYNTTAKTITRCIDGGFLYICARDRVIKINYVGDVIGTFGASDEFNITFGYENVYHDDNRNLYIVNKNQILKYIDKLDLLTLRVNSDSFMWPMSTIYIDRDEYIQDWVVTRSFSRMWDNIEIFRRSLLGKFDYKDSERYQTITQTVNDPVSGVVTIIEQIVQRVPVVRTFTREEYEIPAYSKESIYIGINEIQSADVFNRCLNKLYECENTILRMIED